MEYDEWQLFAGRDRLPPADGSGMGVRLSAGTTTEFASGSDEEMLRKYAVFQASRAATGGSKLPNGWGLFDMHGNVWEWCHDWRDLMAGTTRLIRSGLPRARAGCSGAAVGATAPRAAGLGTATGPSPTTGSAPTVPVLPSIRPVSKTPEA